MVTKQKEDSNSEKASLSSSLFKKVIHGGLWVFSLRIQDRCFTFIRTIIIARMLAPDDFGLFGIAMLTLHTLETFSVTGFDAALIQMKKDTDLYLDTAWVVQVLRGVILGFIMFFGAPIIASFFDQSAVVLIVKASGIAVFIESLKNIGVVYFLKELEFRKQFIFKFSGTIANFVIAISAVIILKNVWALVLGVIARNLVQTVISYFIHPYRPKWKMDWGKSKELFRFGRWIMSSNFLVFLHNEGDDILLGKLLGAGALGLYQLAYRISNLPASEITKTISQVTFPAYAQLQDYILRLKKAYLRVLQFCVFLSIPISGAIVFFAGDFSRLFLTEKWLPMIPAIQILAIWGFIRSIEANTGPLFTAVGKPKLITKILVFKLIVLYSSIYPLTINWGIIGTSLAVVFSAIMGLPVSTYFVINIIKCKLTDIAKVFLLPVVITLLTSVIIYPIRLFVLTKVSILNFITLGLMYIGIILILSIFGIQVFRIDFSKVIEALFKNRKLV